MQAEAEGTAITAAKGREGGSGNSNDGGKRYLAETEAETAIVALKAEAAVVETEVETALSGGICGIYGKRLFRIVEKLLLIRLQFPLAVGSRR
jgi:hypothetical protein